MADSCTSSASAVSVSPSRKCEKHHDDICEKCLLHWIWLKSGSDCAEEYFCVACPVCLEQNTLEGVLKK